MVLQFQWLTTPIIYFHPPRSIDWPWFGWGRLGQTRLPASGWTQDCSTCPGWKVPTHSTVGRLAPCSSLGCQEHSLLSSFPFLCPLTCATSPLMSARLTSSPFEWIGSEINLFVYRLAALDVWLFIYCLAIVSYLLSGLCMYWQFSQLHNLFRAGSTPKNVLKALNLTLMKINASIIYFSAKSSVDIFNWSTHLN